LPAPTEPKAGRADVAAALRYQHVVDGQQDAIAAYVDGVARASFSDREATKTL
jgi:hypothetical protein